MQIASEPLLCGESIGVLMTCRRPDLRSNLTREALNAAAMIPGMGAQGVLCSETTIQLAEPPPSSSPALLQPVGIGIRGVIQRRRDKPNVTRHVLLTGDCDSKGRGSF
jgi:hypothetical protein